MPNARGVKSKIGGEVAAWLVSTAPNKQSIRPTVAAPQSIEEQAPAAEATGESDGSPPSEPVQGDTSATPTSEDRPQHEGNSHTLNAQPTGSSEALTAQVSDLAKVDETHSEPPEPKAQAQPPPTPRPGTPRQPQRSRWPHFYSGP